MIEVVGPFLPEHKVTIGGFHVPHIAAFPMPDGSIDIVLDSRLGLEGAVPRAEFNRWIPILADAMAIAGGYSCHGESCTPLNPHKTRLSSLGSLPPNLSVIDGGKEDAPSPAPSRAQHQEGGQ